MTDKNKPTYEEAKAVVDREASARKDGVTIEKEDAGSGILMKPDPNDRSVRTYDPKNIEREEGEQPKPSKNSGEPVHDRS